MALRTPSSEEINALAQYLGHALGEALQCVVLHGSQAREPAGVSEHPEGGDADLVVVVADIAMDRAPRLVEQVRWAAPFRGLNLALNCVGYHGLCEALSVGHPFFVSAVETGICVDSIDGCWDSLRAITAAPGYRVDRGEVEQMLQHWARAESRRAEQSLREVYRSLVNLTYNAAQRSVLPAAPDSLDAAGIVMLAQWPELFANVHRTRLAQEHQDLLAEVYAARGQISRGETPALGADLHTALAELQNLTLGSPDARQSPESPPDTHSR